MALKSFARVRTGDSVLDRIQDAIERAFSPLAAKPQLDSIVLTSVSLKAASVTHVPHKLGRKLSGWTVIRRRADSRVWDTQDTNTTPQLTLDLHCSADVVVDLEVF